MLCLASGQYRQAATCYGLCTHPTQTSLKREVQCKLPECYDYSSSSTLMPNTFTLTNAAAPHPTPPHPPVGHHGSEGWQQQPGPWPASQGWLQPHAGLPGHHAGGREGGSWTPHPARGMGCECAAGWAAALETPAGSGLLSAAATKHVKSSRCFANHGILYTTRVQIVFCQSIYIYTLQDPQMVLLSDKGAHGVSARCEKPQQGYICML